MQHVKIKERTAVLLGVGIVMSLIFFAVISNYSKNSLSIDNIYKNTVEKKKLLSEMRIHLLKSVEMEKNAVMASTDEVAMDFASQSRAASAAVMQDLNMLRSLIDALPLQAEKKLLGEFTQCWADFGTLDQAILDLVGENSNLKAARLSREKGAETMQRFERALEALMQSYSGTANEVPVMGLSYRALVAGLSLYNLHSPHIAEANDAKMDEIEALMQAEENEVAASLDALNTIVGVAGRDTLAQAKTAFAQCMEVTSSVVKLSRQNSNIKSLELSLGRKRTIAAQCDEILAALQETGQNSNGKATR